MTHSTTTPSGPLAGLRVLETGGTGPVPVAGMFLADNGAEVIRLDRFGGDRGSGMLVSRGKKSICIDLKKPAGKGLLLEVVDEMDIVLEAFRPGVAERLGFGPDDCLARNPRLIYGRMTGWGQEGPLAQTAGHDINYISVIGALDAIGREGESPVPPLNLVGDMGGGSMFLLFGVLSALYERQSSGRGQVIDAAMVDGASLLLTIIHDMVARGTWGDRGTNLLDSGAPYFNVYETKDGRHLSIGSLEPQFYALVKEGLGFADGDLPEQTDRSRWPEARKLIGERIKTQPLQHWVDVFDGTDACVTPVLSLTEAPEHPHNVARGTFATIGGVRQPSPGPRFSRTPQSLPEQPAALGAHTREVLAGLGMTDSAIDRLFQDDIIR
ncbi:CoA transferase [Rhodococcus sp. 14C212]|uniref:CaiB/BaiF CoA transferase family protein n=1 Tax=Rhodococcus sp. 14C212 TaxID=2711209 RepID=UPI0013EAD74D|nr:CaiB/BaiF CoA-transferase family protein [Rhodococcus sp. 14C212]NGP07388.1 CoA transferase [Rhodococcus sp. 14C212]